MIKWSILPSLITLGNLFFGWWAIIMIVHERYLVACWLIVVAAIMDGLDGLVARWTRQSSRFGVEMDSFADSISFALAPSLLVYQSTLRKLVAIGLILTFLPLLAGVLRLVRFNVTALKGWSKTRKPLTFTGLPVPACALTLVGYYLYAYELNDGAVEGTLFLSLIPALALLMVSPIRYRRMPVVKISESRRSLLGAGLALLLVVVLLRYLPLTIFPVMMIYIPVSYTHLTLPTN